MQTRSNIGRYIFGIAIFGTGLNQVLAGDFVSDLIPLRSLPLASLWFYLTAFVLIIAGGLALVDRFREYALIAIGALFLLLFLYPHLPRLLSNVKNPLSWTAAFETLALGSGALLLLTLTDQRNKIVIQTSSREKWIQISARLLLAASLLVFGIQHLMYETFIIALIPQWLPFKFLWSALVQIGFIGAAVSLFLNIKVRLSMLLLACMFLSWVLILHGPRTVVKLSDHKEWAALLIALGMGGISLGVSEGFRTQKRPAPEEAGRHIEK